MREIARWVCAALLLATACPSARPDPADAATGSLRVRALDPSGKAVTGVVQLEGGDRDLRQVDHPDADGDYRFRDLAPGEYAVQVKAARFRPQWQKTTVTAGKETELVVHLDAGASVEGVVVDGAGKALPGVTVEARLVDGEDPSPSGWVEWPIFGPSATTDAQGRFRIEGLAARAATLTASRGRRGEPGRLVVDAPFAVKPPAAGLRIVVWPSTAATLRLVTPEGKPLKGESGPELTVAHWLRGDFKSLEIENEQQPGPDSRYVLDDLPAGVHELEIAAAGYVLVERTWTARPHERADLGTAVLDRGVRLRGSVRGPDGTAYAHARVLALSSRADGHDPATWLAGEGLRGVQAGNRADTDEDGSFTFEHVPLGRAYVEASGEGLVATPVVVEVQADTPPVTLALSAGAAVWCTVKRADGSPASDDRLMAIRWGEDGQPSPAVRREVRATDEQGRCGFRLTTGRWRIVRRTFPKGQNPGEVTLGEWTFTAGETRELALTLPR